MARCLLYSVGDGYRRRIKAMEWIGAVMMDVCFLMCLIFVTVCLLFPVMILRGGSSHVDVFFTVVPVLRRLSVPPRLVFRTTGSPNST